MIDQIQIIMINYKPNQTPSFQINGIEINSRHAGTNANGCIQRTVIAITGLPNLMKIRKNHNIDMDAKYRQTLILTIFLYA